MFLIVIRSILTVLGFVCASVHVWHLVHLYRSNPVNTIFKAESVSFVFPDVTICSLSPTSEERLTRSLRVSEPNEPPNLLADTFHFVNTVLNFGPGYFGSRSIRTAETRLKKYPNISFASQLRKIKRNWKATLTQWMIKWKALYKSFVRQHDKDKLLQLKGKMKDYLTILKSSFSLYNISFSVNDMILDCTYKRKPCNFSHFHLVEDNHYWNCYTFRPTERTLLSSEATDGLDMVLLSWSANQFANNHEINPNTWLNYKRWLIEKLESVNGRVLSG